MSSFSKKSISSYLNDDFVPATRVDEADQAVKAAALEQQQQRSNSLTSAVQNEVGTDDSSSNNNNTNVSSATATTTTAIGMKPVSFGLSTTSTGKLRQKLVGNVQLEEAKPQAELIRAVSSDGKLVALDSSKRVAPKVVPLLDSNGALDTDVALRTAAINALLSDAKNDANSTASTSDVVVIPMLVKNRLKGLDEVAGGEDEKFRYDVSCRPDEPSLNSYENMPVEMIGEAMLRGMGWQPGAGVGRSRVIFEPVDFVKRPGRLGLGAKVDDMLPPTHVKKDRAVKPGESREQSQLGALNADGTFKSVRRIDEQLVALKKRELVVGTQIVIIDGRHADMAGRIEQLLADEKLAVRLTSDELVTVARTHVVFQDVYNATTTAESSSSTATTSTTTNESTSSRSNSRRGGLQKPNGNSITANGGGSSNSSVTMSNDMNIDVAANADQLSMRFNAQRHDSIDTNSVIRRSNSTNEPQQQQQTKRTLSSSNNAAPIAAATTESASKKRKTEPLWIRPHIMVRIISKTYREGRFYEKKARIVDCIGGEQVVLELDDGRVLEGVAQSMIENVVGRDNQRVQVLRGEHVGALGTVLKRDAAQQRCNVQLDSDMQSYPFSFDDVALYVGPEQ